MSRLRDHGVEIDWTEYEHFRLFGWDVARIAARLGVLESSLRTALDRRRAAQQRKTGGAA